MRIVSVRGGAGRDASAQKMGEHAAELDMEGSARDPVVADPLAT